MSLLPLTFYLSLPFIRPNVGKTWINMLVESL